MDILTVSLGRNILKSGSRERIRMEGYAEYVNTLHIIVLTRKHHGFRTEEHEKNLHLYPTNSSSRFMMLIDAFFIGKKIIREMDSSSVVISAQDPLEIGWFCWLLARVTQTRLHIQVHGDYFSSNAWVHGSPLRYIRRFFARILLQRVSAVRVVSERIKKSLVQSGVANERITVLPIRPELEAFLQMKHDNTPPETCTFLYVGRLAEEKDIFRILKSFKMLYAKYPAIRLRLVGDGEKKADVLDFIQREHLNAVVTLTPWTEDVPACMAKADVFLLASKHEAYALTLIEAMAVGLPIVTTDVGCVGEILKDDEQGVVVKEKSVASYTWGMERMITDSAFRKQCGEAGKRTAQKIAETSFSDYAHSWAKSIGMSVPREV